MCEIKQELFEKLAELNKIGWVNAGGCAIIAYNIVKWIEQNHQVYAEVVYLYCSEYQYNNAKNNVNGSCDHAVIKYNNRYYDTNGAYDVSKYRYILPLNQYRVLKSISYRSHWNPMFDRYSGPRQINKILQLNTTFAKG